jgi:transcriptional regulator with XRE-family HTH domain
MKITGAQIRAARAFLRWTIADLATAADVGLSTIQKVEEIDGEPRVVSTLQWRSDARDEAVTKIRGALEKAGITFLPESAHGVGLRGRHKG